MTKAFQGCFTALITPMFADGSIDYEGLLRLVEFQEDAHVSGILAMGTTGETPTLTWEEHMRVIKEVRNASKESLVLAGTGSNCTQEALLATREAYEMGCDGALLVDPYYNGPSSLEIRREYVSPIANAVSKLPLIIYLIPGRTGTLLLPADLAIASGKHQNIIGVKEATGNTDNMKAIRRACGKDFAIFSGDDDKTHLMMTDKEIMASGVISVVSNLFPKAVQEMTEHASKGNLAKAYEIHESLSPIFKAVTIKTQEKTQFGEVEFKARNPLPVKTLLNLLGMPSGPCRRPLGLLTHGAMKELVSSLLMVYKKDPSLFSPIEEFFHVDAESRLQDKAMYGKYCYECY